MAALIISILALLASLVVVTQVIVTSHYLKRIRAAQARTDAALREINQIHQRIRDLHTRREA